jgi:hypothetical protein
MQPVDPMTAYFANIAAAGETGVAGFGRQGQISPDTGGSKSYGVFGLNTRGRNSSASRFAMQFGPTLGLTAPVGTRDFDQQWQGLAAKNPEALKKAQMDWFNGEITSKVAPSLTQLGIPDSVASDPRVQGYFSDRMVQQGPASTTNHAARIRSAFAQANGDPVAFLHNVSAADKSALNSDFVTYLSEHPENARGLANRVDKRTALALNGEAGAEDNTGASTMMPALSPRNLAGGPGALSNTEDDEQSQSLLGRFWQKPEDGANALQQAGAYITSIADPKAGASLLAAAKAYGRNKPKPEFKIIGQDEFGAPKYGWVDTVNQRVVPFSASGAPEAGQAPGTIGDTSLQGDDYLKTLPANIAAAAQAAVEGRAPPPSAGSLKNPLVQKTIAAAQHLDPEFDLTTWGARNAGHKDFYGGGDSSKQVKSLNQAISHMGSLVDSAEKLPGHDSPMINSVENFFNTQVLGKGDQTEFKMNAHAVAEELSKVFKGSNMSDAEIKKWEEGLQPNMSPEQKRAAIGKLTELLHGGMSALDDKRKQSLGDASRRAKKGSLLAPDAQQQLEKIKAWVAAGSKPAGAPAGAPAGLPTGVKSIQLIQ